MNAYLQRSVVIQPTTGFGNISTSRNQIMKWTPVLVPGKYPVATAAGRSQCDWMRKYEKDDARRKQGTLHDKPFVHSCICGRSGPELKGSIGEGSNYSNFSDRSSVRILSKFRYVSQVRHPLRNFLA